MERKQNEPCDKCFNLDAELLKSQNAFNDLLKRYSQLKRHCISLESSIQLNQEIFQKDESCDNQNAREIPEFFEHNDLKAQLQDKDTTIPTTHVAEEADPMPHDSPLLKVYSLGSDEGSLTLNELMVKKLEHKGRKIAQIDKDDRITLVQMGAQTQERSDEDLMYETGVYDYPEGFTGPSISITIAEPVTTAGEGVSTARAIPEEVSTAEPDMDVTLAEALVDLLKSGKKKSPKPKARGISFQDPEEVARREVISPPVSKISAKDKGKAIMTEPEKPLKKKDQIQSDEELALRLHAEEQAEFERLQKERAAQEEASRAAIYEEMDNIQAMIKADEQLAARVQAEEQELYSIKEKSRLLVEMIAERKGSLQHKEQQSKGVNHPQKLR
ncbi:hypothetical protein Tco_0725423 [Tanacetum coccineum]|uniref:Uncharacterized protein n=1 Tax=Tanacetum coccineum TaxID=301880 RepID=A0ABQ4YDP0_9ASTR